MGHLGPPIGSAGISREKRKKFVENVYVKNDVTFEILSLILSYKNLDCLGKKQFIFIMRDFGMVFLLKTLNVP